MIAINRCSIEVSGDEQVGILVGTDRLTIVIVGPTRPDRHGPVSQERKLAHKNIRAAQTLELSGSKSGQTSEMPRAGNISG